MDTATKHKRPAHPSDKVVEALATLGALLDRTINDVKKNLDKDVEEQLLQSVREAETSLRAETIQHVERARQSVSDELTSRFQTELQAALGALRSEFDAERNQLNQEIQQAREAVARLESEKSALSADMQRLQSESTDQGAAARQAHEEAMARLRSEHQGAVESLQAGFNNEREGLNQQLRQSAEAVTRLQAEKEAEKADLSATVERVRNEAVEQSGKTQHELTSKFQSDTQAALDALKNEFAAERERLNQAAQKAMETSSRLESEKAELAATVERVRKEAVELSGKTQHELTSKLQSDMQAALDALKNEFAGERERLNQELQRVTADGSRLESDKAGMAADIERVKEEAAEQSRKLQEELTAQSQKDLQHALDNLKSEFGVERDRLNKELRYAVDTATRLETERSGLITEVRNAKESAAEETAKARAEVQAASKSASSGPVGPPPSVQVEITRAETKLQELQKIIDDPATELSSVIRKNVEKSELDAYLKGIRYVIETTRG